MVRRDNGYPPETIQAKQNDQAEINLLTSNYSVVDWLTY